MPLNYVVAAIHSWNVEAFHQETPSFPGRWHLMTRKEELTAAVLDRLAPRYVFFPHWSWRVPADILAAHECVCFHMTDVPYGRGGSPLQNLIVRGHAETMVSALRMEREMDAGPVYMKRPLSLRGSAAEIYARAAGIAFDMMKAIAADEPEPVPQRGDVTVFFRRTPDQSLLPADGPLSAIFDHIRMLDAEGYPHAFVAHGEYRIELTDARMDSDSVRASVVIFKNPNSDGMP